jgi:hypothetical protein
MATWAGIALQHPGWAGLLHPQLGRRSLSAPRHPAPVPAPGGPLLLSRAGRHASPRLGRLTLPRLGPGWASAASCRLGRDQLPGWACLPRLGPFSCDSAWAGKSALRLGRSPAGRHPPPRPAGPDQEDPAWPGFLPRAPLLAPAGPAYSVPAGPGWDPWPRPDYFHGRPR